MNSVIRRAARNTHHLGRPRPAWLLVTLNALLLVTVLVFLFTLPSSIASWRKGQVAGETVVAQRKLTYIDHVATAARRKQAIENVPITYHFDPRLAKHHSREAATFLSTARTILLSGTPAVRRGEIPRLLPAGISAAPLQQMPRLSASDYPVVRNQTLQLLQQAQAWRFDSDQLQSTSLALLSTIPSSAPLLERTAIGDLLAAFLTPTQIPDLARTSRDQAKAAAAVAPVLATIVSGQVIVRRGDIVSGTTLEQLNALGLQNGRTDWQSVGASLFFAAAIITMLFWYLRAFHPSILANARMLLLLDGSILATVVGARLVSGGHVLIPFFLPVATASTFAAVLIAPEAAVALALAMAMLAGWVVANSFELTSYYFLTGAAGVLAVRHVKQLKQFIFAGACITAFALAATLAFGLVGRTYDFGAFQDFFLAAAFNGFVSSALALGGYTLFSGLFGVTSSLHLLELAQPNQPLLRRLTAKAPGTYNHSLVVSNMAEHAAEEIGANSLVAKVAALYHDVGKTTNPHCFVENQLGMHNVHDDLHPDESARIIRGHVPQGLRLARQQKLPRVVLDGIAEHHGTMTLAYFLHKAKLDAGSESIDLSLYSYPGPKPQSKETALLMLADGCESAVRASADHSPERISELVEQIFAERIVLDQLDDCPLTLRDIDLAKRAFCSVLNGMYHPRIEYPTERTHEVPEVPIPFPADAASRSRPSRTAADLPRATRTSRVRARAVQPDAGVPEADG